jgi:hypothetical protein
MYVHNRILLRNEGSWVKPIANVRVSRPPL